MGALAGLGAVEGAIATPCAAGSAKLGSGLPSASLSRPAKASSGRTSLLAWLAWLAKIVQVKPGLLVSGVTFALGGMAIWPCVVALEKTTAPNSNSREPTLSRY